MTGTVLVLSLVEVIEGSHFSVTEPVSEFFPELAIGALIGAGAGFILVYAVASTARTGVWD